MCSFTKSPTNTFSVQSLESWCLHSKTCLNKLVCLNKQYLKRDPYGYLIEKCNLYILYSLLSKEEWYVISSNWFKKIHKLVKKI